MGAVIIGIDLGTTNCAVGVWRAGRVELIPNSLGELLTPSAVSLDDDGSVLVGLAARERQTTHPSLTATTFKRYMGTRREVRLGKRTFYPEDLSALMLRRLKADAEAYLGEPLTEAVITVPAYFNDRQRKATKRAGELAGLRVERLVNEPTAAALAYGIHQLDHGSQFLVFDLGGGTFDVSILEIFEGVIEVRSTTGDNHLGGEDFNDLIVEDMRARLGSHLGREAGRKELFLQRLRAAAERVRRALTVQDAARAEIVWDDRTYAYEITAEQFEEKAKALLAKLRDPVIRALRDADVQAEALNEIILVGGATRMPIVRRLVTRMFGRFPSATVNPDEVVAVGAAILGGLKVRDSALEEVVFTDVCPYSLGVDASERAANGRIRSGIFCPIIERSTVVPASRVKLFSTLQDSQRKVIFNVYQGESRRVAENILLGRIEIPVPPAAAGEISLECRFSYDINGLIEVDVRVSRTDERRQLVIVDDDGPSGEELRRQREALAALKTHPRDLDANRAVVARAARCYETTLGDVREHVGSILARFEAVLDGQDPREADLARNALIASLDALEGKTFL